MTALVAANDLDLNSHKLTNVGPPDPASDDGARIVDVETASTADRARANHTGTQLASTISNFDTQVRTSRLDQMATPTAPVSLGSQKIENLADGTAGTDAINLNQLNTAVAGIAGGLAFKGVAQVVHTANVNIANPGTATFDGQTIATGQVVILDGQTTGTQDGPMTFNGSGVAMTRPTNWDTAGEAVVGSFWVVTRGTQADKFAVMSNDTFTLGTDEPEFVFIGVSSSDNDGSFSQNVGTGSAGPYTVTHSLNSEDVDVVVRELATGYKILVSWKPTSVNAVSIEPDETWATNSHRAYVSRVA